MTSAENLDALIVAKLRQSLSEPEIAAQLGIAEHEARVRIDRLMKTPLSAPGDPPSLFGLGRTTQCFHFVVTK